MSKAAEYGSDATLAVTVVNIAAHHSRPVSLAEIFSLVELETRLKFAYAPGPFSLADEIVLPAGSAIPLTELLTSISAQKPITFERSGDQITVRAASPVAPSATAERTSIGSPVNLEVVSESAPVIVSPVGNSRAEAPDDAAQLAAAVRDIVAGSDSSRSKKEKLIATAVRSALAAAYAEVESKADLLNRAIDLVTAAAGAAPQFSELIANTAAFTPAIAGVKSGGAKLRAAAYGGARSPKSASASAGQDPSRARAAGLREPADQTVGLPASSTASASSEVSLVATQSTRMSADSTLAPTATANPAIAEPAPDSSSAGIVSRTITVSAPSASSAEATPERSDSIFSTPSLTSFSAPPLEVPAGNAPARNEPAGADNSIVQMEKFGVQGGLVKNSQTTLREKASVSVDVITTSDFGKFISTDISDIIIRMPGLSTTTRGSFAVVRGLAERYNPILLDGFVLPSSDPERQTPELDLFPTRLVDAVVVNKVFEPRLPGTSSGGAIDLRTKAVPEGRFAQVQFGLRAEEGAMKDEPFFALRTSGRWDRVALGIKDRIGAPASDSESIAVLKSADTHWSGMDHHFPIGAKFSAVYEDRLDLGGEGRAFGYSLSFGYDSSAASEETRVFGFRSVPPGSKGLVTSDGKALVGNPTGEDSSEFEQEVRLGGLVSMGYAFNFNHSLGLSLFISQIGTNNVLRTYQGFSGLQNTTLEQLNLLYQAFDTGKISPAFKGVAGGETLARSESVYYRQRNLTDLKLSGEHKVTSARSPRIEWAAARIKASQDEPDFAFLGYQQGFPALAGDKSLSVEYGQPGRNPSRYWRAVSEITMAGRLDGQIDFDMGWAGEVRLRSGAYFDNTERTFRQHAFFLGGGSSSIGNTLDELVADMRKAPFEPGQGTQRIVNVSPAFSDAKRKQAAAYMSLSLPLISERQWARKLDLLVGARLETYQLNATGRGQFFNEGSTDYYLSAVNLKLIAASQFGTDTSAERIFARTVDEDTVHPSAALTWSPVDRLNVRLGYSRTVARPSFRELGSYFTNDEVTNEIQHGNVYLNTSRVDNLDFRIEYFFPKRRDLVALSFFKKRVENPIEKAKLSTTGVGTSVLGWFNNPGNADVKGAEFEAAKNLGFLGEFGSPFTLGGNATLIDAKVGVSRNEAGFLEGRERTLFDQPEWIANAYLSFDHNPSGFATTLSWFAISDVLRSVDANTWNTYVASHSRIDLTLSQRLGRRWHLRLSAKNITDPVREFIADPEIATDGVVLRTFKDGRSYSMTATYDF